MQPKDFVQNYERALANQDWKNVEPLIAERASVTFSNGTVHEGKEAIRAAFERNFKLIKSEEYKIKNVRWLFTNESTAVYLFDFSWKGMVNNQLVGGEGIGTSVLIQDEGKWVLLTEHLGRKG